MQGPAMGAPFQCGLQAYRGFGWPQRGFGYPYGNAGGKAGQSPT
jgi:hypothetical protein